MAARFAAALAALALLAGCAGQANDGIAPSSGVEGGYTEALPEGEAGDSRSEAVRQPAAEPFDYRLDPRIPQELRDEIAQRRGQIYLPYDDNLEARVNALLTGDLDAEKDRKIAGLLTGGDTSAPETLTRQQARDDVAFLFDYLRYGYAGYEYLGGDEVFLQAKADILRAVDELPEPITTGSFQNTILTPILSQVVVDNHFILGDVSFAQYHTNRYFLYSEQLRFHKGGSRFYTEGELQVLSVNGERVADWIRPTLTGEGEVVWAVCTMAHTDRDQVVELELMDQGGQVTTWELTLSAADTTYRESLDRAVGYNRYEREGVTVVENRHLEATAEDDYDTHDDPELNRLVDGAADLRDEPVLIVDLRGNRGGDDYYACRWLEEYAGLDTIEYYGSAVCTLMTETVHQSAAWIRGAYREPYEEARDAGEIPGWLETVIVEPNRAASDNTVFVLIDSYVASSGESFVALLQEMENVVIVGTATTGMGTVGNGRDIYLPESRTRVMCGISLFLTPDLSLFEGVGYQPDLWVPPGESLERVLAFIGRYLRD